MYEGGDGKNRETFPCIPDEPSKPRNFLPSKLLSFTVVCWGVILKPSTEHTKLLLGHCWSMLVWFGFLIL